MGLVAGINHQYFDRNVRIYIPDNRTLDLYVLGLSRNLYCHLGDLVCFNPNNHHIFLGWDHALVEGNSPGLLIECPIKLVR
jgi:hypothetical protein